MNPRSTPRGGLGRGLGALIPTAPPTPPTEEPHSRYGLDGSTEADVGVQPTTSGSRASVDDPVESHLDGGRAEPAMTTVAGSWFAELPVDRIRPNRVQPRQVFDEEAMAELVFSIQAVGLLQPVVVRELGGDDYELVMGERRWRATQLAGLTTIPAIVRGTDDNAMLRDALLENLHRSQLNPLEEAAAYEQLLVDFGCTHEELAGRIGRSRPQISNTIRLLKLSPPVQRRVAAGVLSAGHARALLTLDDADLQDRLAQRVVAEGISVRGLEEIVSVGGAQDRRTRQVRKRPAAPGLADLSERLSDRLETRVRIDLGKSRGRITVDFATLEDLQRIVDIMDPRNRDDRPI